MKAVISDPKTGKSYQVELDKPKEAALVGKKVGEKIEGAIFGASGYSFEIRGGSDTSGFPMRKDISGTRKLAPILTKGVGFHSKRKGARQKKTVRGNTIATDTAQVNFRIMEHGTANLDELFPKIAKKDEKK